MIIKRFTIVFLLFLTILPGTKTAAATLSSRAGAVTTASGSLNVRAEPNAGAAKVASLPKGSHITLISRQGDWWQVEYGADRRGYCAAAYITPIQGTAVTVTTAGGSLNVRSGAGTQYAKTGALPNGEVVVQLTSANGWSRILYHGTKTGYVSSGYLKGASGGAVSLAVPLFRQTDPRWADILLGSSGKPMSQIGCATTAIAMVESYRQGRTITPDTMARQLRYTAGGSVYWPEHYKVVTLYSLAAVETLLRQGKPVLFGSRNAYGSQHWVVITGYNGASLTAANFTIHDPGTHSRTNLQQFLNVYPNFYKYFYY